MILFKPFILSNDAYLKKINKADAYKIDIANRNSDCSWQFLTNIDVFDGNAEKLIEGKIRDWDGLPDFEPNAPIINENINHEKLH